MFQLILTTVLFGTVGYLLSKSSSSSSGTWHDNSSTVRRNAEKSLKQKQLNEKFAKNKSDRQSLHQGNVEQSMLTLAPLFTRDKDAIHLNNEGEHLWMLEILRANKHAARKLSKLSTKQHVNFGLTDSAQEKLDLLARLSNLQVRLLDARIELQDMQAKAMLAQMNIKQQQQKHAKLKSKCHTKRQKAAHA